MGFDGTGRRGPVGGRERAQCLLGHGDGTAGCAGMHEATRSYQEDWAAPNGVEPPFCSLSAATVVLPPQDTPTQVGQGATDARNEPSARVVLRTGSRVCEQRAKRTEQEHSGSSTVSFTRKS